MANDFNTPSFNVDPDDSTKWGPPTGPPINQDDSMEDKSKNKPRKLFEDNLPDTGAAGSSGTANEKQTKKKSKNKKSDNGSSKKKGLWITLFLILIIAGGLFFLHTQGYLDFRKMLTQVEGLKNKIFGGGTADSTKTKSLASADSMKSKRTEISNKVEPNPQESGKKDLSKLLKAPVKPTTVKTDEKNKKDLTKSSKITNKSGYKPTPIKKEKEVKKTISHKGGKFAIQVSSWKKRSTANQEVKKIRKVGLKAYVQRVTLPDLGGRWFRVLIGSYQSNKEAEENIQAINKELNTVCVVREK
jgi:cell division septation protein DedD